MKKSKIQQEIEEYKLLLNSASVPDDEKEFARKELQKLEAKLQELESPKKSSKKDDKVKKTSVKKSVAIKKTKTPEHLRGVPKKNIEKDAKRLAKPAGYRFVGDSMRKPTKAEIIKGKKDGSVYFESRRERSDVSRVHKLQDGGNIIQNKVPNPVIAKIQYNPLWKMYQLFVEGSWYGDFKNRPDAIKEAVNGRYKIIDESGLDEILIISQENPLSKQLIEKTGTTWNSEDFETLLPGDPSIIRHKNTGSTFFVVTERIKNELGEDKVKQLSEDAKKQYGLMYEKGGEIIRNLGLHDSVLWKGKTHYITEKDGKLGLVNFDRGAWGTDYPVISLDTINIDELTDMMGRKVNISKFSKGGGIDKPLFENGEIVWDSNNKRYGTVLNNYGGKGSYGEIRLDSDGNQPIEDLYKLGSAGDKGTKKQLIEALNSHKRLVDEYGYEKVNYKTGGEINSYTDLFEDFENIPENVQAILDEYSDDFEDGNYEGIQKAKELIEKEGYTFEYYLDGKAYGLRPINIPLNQLKGYEEDVSEQAFKNGGKVEEYEPSEYLTKEQYEKFREWFKTGKVDGKKEENPIIAAKLIGASTSMWEAYRKEQIEKNNDTLEVELESLYNPHNKSGRNIKAHRVKVKSLLEASNVVRKFIKDNDMGSGNFPESKVYKNNKPVAYISYNGKVWSYADKTIELLKSGGPVTKKEYTQKKMKKVMGEFKKKELTSHGKTVKNRKQAIAIGLSEAKSGWKFRKKRKKS